MKTIRINRKRWLRGKDDGLLWVKSNRKGCCLGHAVKQLTSCTWKELSGNVMPADVLSTDELFKYFGTYDGFGAIAEMNDTSDIKDEVREDELKKMFKHKFNLKLEFYN